MVKDRYQKTFMKMALIWSQESKCIRKKVGCLIVKDNRIISIGYNGLPSGYNREGKFECENIDENDRLKTVPEVIHAEANAILFAAKEGISLKDSSMFITLSPCFECAKMIIQSGIKEIYILDIYKDWDKVEKFLLENNIKINKMENFD